MAEKPSLAVAVTILPQAWLVREVGGSWVEVTTLVAPGESPEMFQPTDAQVSRLMRSAIYFRIGVPAEDAPWFGAVESARRVAIVDLRRGVEMRAMSHRHRSREPDTDAGGLARDPHIWLSPRRLQVQARTVAEALTAAVPERRDEIRRNLERLEQKLADLDAELRQLLRPCAGRSVLVFHPSWGYFADDYGLRQVAIEVEGKEPSDHEITQLRQLARREGLRVVFVQPQVSGRSARAVAQAIGGRTETLDPLAADVPANLRRAAERIAASFGG